MRSIVLVVVGMVLVASAAFVVLSHGVGGAAPTVSATTDVRPSWTDPVSGIAAPTVAPSVTATAPAEATVTYPAKGSDRYDVVPGGGAVIGSAGTLMRFQVAIEQDVLNLDATAVAAFVESTYADPRGWASAGRWRFQRVGPGQAYDFVVYLVTPGTRDALCGGTADRYTNCRDGTHVVINMDRWVSGVPDYGASLEEYRRYAINHETGHRLGDGHELCPGPGQPAPVMQQQTLGLHGCVAYAWPYLDGKSYHGKSGAYDDPVPR